MGLDSTCFAIGNGIKCIAAILNTTVGNYLFKDSPKTGTGDLLVSVQAFEPILVPKLTDEVQHVIEILLDKITDAQNKSVDFQPFENELENLVYQLYGFDEVEIIYIESVVKSMFRQTNFK